MCQESFLAEMNMIYHSFFSVYFFSAPSFEATHETGAVEPADGAKNKEYPKSLEEESLSNVASVSKFIKEFHVSIVPSPF